MENSKDEPWYAVKAIFYHKNRGEFEERILLVRASDFDRAREKAQAEAEEYIQNLDGVEFIEWIDIFHLFGETIKDKTEVYSKLTLSPLSPQDYLEQKYGM